MVIDLIMGNAAIVLAGLLAGFSAPLATLMREGDDRWREQPWTQSFEPDVAFLESERGRWWIFRGWLLLSAVGFLAIGVGLDARVLLS